jgi:hypothetical protein
MGSDGQNTETSSSFLCFCIRCVFFSVPKGFLASSVCALREWEPQAGYTPSSHQPPTEDGTMGMETSDLEAGVLLFAGEALSLLDQQQVHGAMESGETAAKKIIARIEQMYTAKAAAAMTDSPDAVTVTKEKANA